jgi:hypothetical protein
LRAGSFWIKWNRHPQRMSHPVGFVARQKQPAPRYIDRFTLVGPLPKRRRPPEPRRKPESHSEMLAALHRRHAFEPRKGWTLRSIFRR